MRRPICIKCQIAFRPLENGITVIDMFSQPPKPYRMWQADLFECPICKAQIVSGFADEALIHHHENGFEDWLRQRDRCSRVYNYEHIEDANAAKPRNIGGWSKPFQQLIKAIGHHPAAENDPDVIDAINALEDALTS